MLPPPAPTMTDPMPSECRCVGRALVALAHRPLVGAPELCLHGWTSFVNRMEARGLVALVADADIEQVLRASGARLIPGPVRWTGADTSPIVDGSCTAPVVDAGYWCEEWDVSAVVAWSGEGRPLHRGGRPHPRLMDLLMRGRRDPEWRDGGETIRRIAGRAAWVEYLARPAAS